MDRGSALLRIRDALACGEYLLAFDAAREARAAFPDDLEARYFAVLALARAGAGERATEELEASGLEAALGEASLGPLARDVAALRARLAKDRALGASGEGARLAALEAAERYEEVYRSFGGAYPCINAATMSFIAGDSSRAVALAREAQRLTKPTPAERAEESYWLAATLAEAALLLDDTTEAVDALGRAASVLPRDLAAWASTRRQLGLICDRKGLDPGILDALPVPSVIHYCGHRVSGAGDERFPVRAVPVVKAEVAARLEARSVGFAYGSLASGADLIIAEAVLERGGEVHAFLPFPVEEFIRTSVLDAGGQWVRRFEVCLEQATSLTILGDGPYLGDDVLFQYCASVAMGRALIRAAFLTADVEQVAVWDRRAADATTGTAADVATWRRRGESTHIIPSRSEGADPSRAEPTEALRVVRTMLFADVAGFSRLDDPHMAAFATVALGAIAEILGKYGDAIVNQRTWGDGIHVVFHDVSSAAHCALDLQHAMQTLNWETSGFTEPLGMRVGVHVGPVIEIYDPIRNCTDFTGTHVVRSARIEPQTPVGDVYVTDPFAALLTLQGDPSVSCQYVGHVPTAKAYGKFPMYVLKRRASYQRDVPVSTDRPA